MDEKENDQNDQPEAGSMKLFDITPYLAKARADQAEDEPAAMVAAIIAAMKDSGADEKTLRTTQKMLEAKFGIGSWQELIAIEEETLKEQAAQNDVLGQLGSLINLVGTAINAGDKEKGRQYVSQAEALFAQITAADIEKSLPGGAPIAAETILQLRRAEIDRLRNWVT